MPLNRAAGQHVTLPGIVEQLAQLNANLKALVNVLGQPRQGAGAIDA
jgi:hypothetical protein